VNLAAKELLLLRRQPFIRARTVDVHIAWLRQKLEENPQVRRYVITIRDEG
jgi:DNA-binding response OmpR family regulator